MIHNCFAYRKLVLLFVLSLIALKGMAQTDMVFRGEKINFTDLDSMKQGKWYYFYDSLQTLVSCSGNYIDNKRQGVWTEYYRNGNRRSEISYLDNHKYGLMKSFYENGNLAEEGYWDGQHWVGSYKYYFANGKIAYNWNYGDEGNRVGEQSYYYDNGQPMRLGTWVDGYADGLVTEYYDSGNLRSESQWKMGRVDGIMREYYNSGSLSATRVFNNGIYDEAASKTYRDRVEQPSGGKDSTIVTPVNQENTIVLEQADNPELFTGTGYYKLLTPDRKVDREGNFVNGTLMSGKRYYYNSSGKVIRIAEYEGGRVVNVVDK